MDKIEQSRRWDEKLNEYISNLESTEKGRLAGEWLNDEAAYTKTIKFLKELYNSFAHNNYPIPNSILNLEEKTVYTYKCIIQDLAESKKGSHSFLTEEDYEKITFEEIMHKSRTDSEIVYGKRVANYNKLFENNDKPKLR
ncbi:MAG: hypothetical protein VZS44_01385 [Bacilli bacterium]|nr:hypothetical protein [Bacilli bacterium]